MVKAPTLARRGSSGDFVKYWAAFKEAFKGLVEGRFRDDRRYLDHLWELGK